MKLPTRLLAGLGIMMIISASPLLHADDRDQHDQGRGGDNHQDNHQDDHHDNRGPGGHPPQNFDHERQTFHDHHEYFTRGRPLPSNMHLVRGRPLPRGYGDEMDPRALQQLPRYDGYEWRRVGPDAVLVAVTTGVVYTILSGVLN
ncbi:MAG: hypothetical protein JWR17_1808 [Pseudomonas sp.]|jgi:Ni/Co efflux regulator RcnB|uniref:anti-virulence regulator CigR family protein n=1 Tax=Pseudomonas sp. TaxID=306 RepID=UPI00262D80BA|nr:anti-virulence regulator CigR family protein [Pseudomonas sp.]MDB6049062.1 hypothetical protein [Pseudomonas sp.]